MAEGTGHARAIDVALSFRLLRNEDLAEAMERCGNGAGPEEHLNWLLDAGRIQESAAAFLSVFMAEVRGGAAHPSKELTEAAKELLIEPDRLEMVWGAQVARPATQPLPIVEGAPPPPPPPPPEEPRSRRVVVLAATVVVLLVIAGIVGVRAWMSRRAEETRAREARESLQRAEGLVAPVRKAIADDDKTVVGRLTRIDDQEAKKLLGAVGEAEKIIPNNVSYLLLEARLRERLGQERFTGAAYDKACGMKPGDPSAFAARGLWTWRRWLRVRSFPWTAKELRGMRACRRTGEANDLEASAEADERAAGTERVASALDTRDALLLRADKLLRGGKAEEALHELGTLADDDATGRASRAAARLLSGDAEGAAADAMYALDHDGGPCAHEVRALARWGKGVYWRWQGCDKTLWNEKVAPLLQDARRDWKAIPFDRADLAPAYDAVRCSVELADGGVTRGVDPTPTLREALMELEALTGNDADALALSAQAHLCLAEWMKSAGQDPRAQKEGVAKDLAAAEKINAKSPEVLIARGRWEAALGRDADARAAWEAAKAAAPDDPRPEALLAGRR